MASDHSRPSGPTRENGIGVISPGTTVYCVRVHFRASDVCIGIAVLLAITVRKAAVLVSSAERVHVGSLVTYAEIATEGKRHRNGDRTRPSGEGIVT